MTSSVYDDFLACHIISNACCSPLLFLNVCLLYADDIVILAPLWCAQQCLLNVCADSIMKLGLSLNVSKSVTNRIGLLDLFIS